MGGGGEQTVGYQYYLGIHAVCTMGPVDKVVALKVGGKLAWQGGTAGGSIVINQPNLFGGDSSEGGVSGTIDFLNGGPDQGVNDYLASKLNDLVPAFRGVSSFVFRQCYLGNNPYLKPWSFVMQRIFTRQDGIEQWYSAKAAIPCGTSISIGGSVEVDVPITGMSNTQAPSSTSVTINANNLSGLTATSTVVITKPVGLTYQAWSAWPTDDSMAGGGPPVPGQTWANHFNVSAGGNDSFFFFADNPNLYPTAQAAEAGVQSFLPVSFTGFDSYTFFIWDPAPADDRGGLSIVATVTETILDMNPAHILRECLTDPDWGMGYNEADIDDTTFMAAADTLFSEGMGMSLLWDSQTELGDFITTILNHIDATIYVDRTSGKFVLKLIRNDYVVADLIELTEDDIDQVQDFKRAQFGELTTSVTVQYWDSLTNTQGSVVVQDIALEAMQQAVVNTTLQYTGFTNSVIATKVAQRDLRTLSSQIATCTLYTSRKAKDLQVGDVFLMTWPDYELTKVPMRITGMAYGDGKTNRIRLTVTEDIFSVDANTFVAVRTPPVWADPNGPPVAPTLHKAFEMPYLELVQQQTQNTVDSTLATDPLMGIVGVACGRPSQGSINAEINSDAGSGYTDVGTADFCPTAKLAIDIDRMIVTFSINNADELDLVPLGSWCQIDDEIMDIVALSDTSITVKRGCLDTLPALHSTGAVLYFWDKFPSADPTQYDAGETINIKLTPKTGSGTLDLTKAPVDTVTLANRAIRPYPPGNLKINGTYFPPQVEGDLVLTWAHRDRTQQTGGSLLGFTDASVGPETGTTYTLKVYNGSNALVRTVSGINDVTTTYTGAMETADGGPFSAFRFTLAAERDGYESWQIYDVSLTRPAPIPTVGVFLPSENPTAEDAHIILWNNGYFVVAIEGTVDGNDCLGFYRISDSGTTPEYVGTTFDHRFDGVTPNPGYIPATFASLQAMNQNVHDGLLPMSAGGVDTKYSIFYARESGTDPTDRFMFSGDNSDGAFDSVNTPNAINADLLAMVRTAAGITWALASGTTSGAPYQLWKSTDGSVWSSQGAVTGLSTSGASIIGRKMFELAGGALFIHDSFFYKNADATGLNWTIYPLLATGTTVAYSVTDVAYDGTALLAAAQVVPALAYDTHVSADTPSSWLKALGSSVTDKSDGTRIIRTAPNGVGITGWGLDFPAGLAFNQDWNQSGALLLSPPATCPAGVGGTYLEPRTNTNSAINVLQGTTDFTIEAWIGFHSTVPNSNSEVVLFSSCKGGNPQFQNVLLTFTTTTNVLRLRTIRQTGANTYANDVDISANVGFNIFSIAATHIVATRGAGGRASLYVNGASVASVASGPITDLTATGSTALGSVWGNTNSRINCTTGAATTDAAMAIDAACLYTHELTAARVLDHYNAAQADGLTRNRLYTSADGQTWTQVRDVGLGADLAPGFAFSLKWEHVISFGTGFAVYGRDPFSGSFPYVLLSTDHGATWSATTQVVTDDPTNNAWVQQVLSHGSRVFATITDRVVNTVRTPNFAYSNDAINFTTIDGSTFPAGSVGIDLIVLDDTGEPRIAETGELRITEG